MLPAVEVREDQDVGVAAQLAVRQFAGGDFGDQSGVHLQFAVEVRVELSFQGFLFGEGGGGLDLAHRGMRGAAFGGEGEQGDPGADAEQMPGKLRGGNGDVGELLDRRLFDDVAVRHEQHAILAQARVFDLHHQATGDAAGVRGGFDGLEERPQHAGGDLTGAGDKAIRLVHGEHHGAEVVGLEHGLARLEALHALARVVAQQLEPAREVVQVLALGRVDDADAFERDVQGVGRFLDPGPVAEQNRAPRAAANGTGGRPGARAAPCLPGRQSASDAAAVSR